MSNSGTAPAVRSLTEVHGREQMYIISFIGHPAETLQPDEAWLLLLTLAREADRWEQQLTGRDYH